MGRALLDAAVVRCAHDHVWEILADTLSPSRFIASTHITSMPWTTIMPAIFAPTFYLWECDARALQRGTWVIEKGTKLGLSFRDLEIE